jgi:hypothetical protein
MQTYSRSSVGNGDLCTVSVRTIKQIGKQVSAVTYTQTYSERTVGYGDFRTVRVGKIKRIGKHVSVETRVEAGSNTSTVTLRVVGGDEKGSLKTGTVKYGPEIQGTRTREKLRWRGRAAYTKDRPVLSSERAPHKTKTVTVKQ